MKDAYWSIKILHRQGSEKYSKSVQDHQYLCPKVAYAQNFKIERGGACKSVKAS